MTDPAEIYLSPPCCSDMVGEGRLWCENDEWPEGDCGTPEEHRPATRYVRADIHEAALKRQAGAAATLESEREANARLTEEIERLLALNAEMREALSDIASGSYSGVSLTSYPPKDPAVERARAALAKSEAVP